MLGQLWVNLGTLVLDVLSHLFVLLFMEGSLRIVDWHTVATRTIIRGNLFFIEHNVSLLQFMMCIL
jgi:hypothetical protein